MWEIAQIDYNFYNIKMFKSTSQIIRAITGRKWREVLGHSLVFMWAFVFDDWLRGLESKWFDQVTMIFASL